MERPSNCWTAELCDGIRVVGLTAIVVLLSACGSGGGSSSSGAGDKASGCLNPTLYALGTQVQQVTTVETPLATEVPGLGPIPVPLQNLHSDSTVLPTTSFNGTAGLTETLVEDSTIFTLSPDIVLGSATRQGYTRLGGKTLLVYGEVTTQALGDDLGLSSALNLPLDGLTPVVTTTANTPAIEQRFDLAPGDSYTQAYSSSLNTDVILGTGPDATIIPIIRSEKQISQKTTYVGRESITVQAGTFEACKFVDEATTPGGTEVTTTWLAVGSGQFLKSENNANVTVELISASINGVPVQ